jgi:hypothetical protein
MPTEEQRRKNRRTGLFFAVLVVGLFAYTVGRQVYLHYFS